MLDNLGFDFQLEQDIFLFLKMCRLASHCNLRQEQVELYLCVLTLFAFSGMDRYSFFFITV